VTGPGVRLFVALDLPEAVRLGLSSWTRLAADVVGGAVRPIREGSLHVTLCFLGETAVARVDTIASLCEVARGFRVGELRLGGGLWLPRRRPRVLAVGLEDPHGRLATLQGELGQALAAIGAFKPDARPFLAHVSVARVRGGDRGRGGDRSRGDDRIRPVELPASPSMAFAAERVVLYRSSLGDGPARYDALHEVQLSRR
jgi:2'-5' RNA ligase